VTELLGERDSVKKQELTVRHLVLIGGR
jgi:hypothetical protein